MLEIRPIVVDETGIVLGGNMRLKACVEAGLKEVPVIEVNDLTDQQKREFIIKDNVSGGEWDWEVLANQWDSEQLEAWGVDIPNFEPPEQEEPSGYDQAWFINIRCDNESQCQNLYERFIKEGLNVKIVT